MATPPHDRCLRAKQQWLLANVSIGAFGCTFFDAIYKFLYLNTCVSVNSTFIYNIFTTICSIAVVKLSKTVLSSEARSPIHQECSVLFHVLLLIKVSYCVGEMATTTPRRSTRLPYTHTPKMSERKKGLFQCEEMPSRESLTTHRKLPVVDSESDSEECDLGIISTLDSSSSGDENDQNVPKTPERNLWRKFL